MSKERIKSLAGSVRKALSNNAKLIKRVSWSVSALLLAWWISGYITLSSRASTLSKDLPLWKEIQEHIKKDRSHANSYYTADSLYLWKFGWRTHKYVPFDEINPALIQAAVWTEDKRFFSHDWVDKIALLAATKSLLSWEKRGWSTLTSQLIKILYWREKTSWKKEFFDVKMKEFLMAQSLEDSFSSKEEAKKFILEWYLNNFHFDNHWSWIEWASQRMFWKSQSELTLDEAAAILSRAVSPSKVNYNWSSKDAKMIAENAKDVVLKDIYNASLEWAFDDRYPNFSLSSESLKQLQEAKTYQEQNGENTNTYWDVNNTFYMKRLIKEAKKYSDANLSIITTLNSEIHNDMIDIVWSLVKRMDQRITPLTSAWKIEVASITTDKEWNVLSYIWWRDKNDTKVFDRVQNDVETWSIIKSLIIWLAIDERVISSINETFIDKKYVLQKNEFGMNNNRTPKNYSWKYSWKKMTFKEGLVLSKNSMMAYLLNKWGKDFLLKIYKYFDDHGITYSKTVTWWVPSPQVILGAGWFEMSPEDIHLLYTTFYDDTTEISWLNFIEKYEDVVSWEKKIATPRIYEWSVLNKKARNQVKTALLEKWRRETSHHFSWGLSDIMIKTWTTWYANKFWMTIITPNIHTTLMLGFDQEYIDGERVGSNNSYYWSSSRVLREFLWDFLDVWIDHWWYDSDTSSESWKDKRIKRSPDILPVLNEAEWLKDYLLWVWEQENEEVDTLSGNENDTASIRESIPLLDDLQYKVIGNDDSPANNIQSLMSLISDLWEQPIGTKIALLFTPQEKFGIWSLSHNFIENKASYLIAEEWVETYAIVQRWDKEKRLSLAENSSIENIPDAITSPTYLYLEKWEDGSILSLSENDIKNFVNIIKSQ